MERLLLATRNPGKLLEMQSLLEGLPLQLILPESILPNLEVVEDGNNYIENASRKALAYQRGSGMVVLADDSGLEVDALGGAPGLHSARYSPAPGAKDADRRKLLLQNLVQYPRPWLAHFHCTVAIATPGGDLFFTEGNCPGEIIPVERGTNGFGYDPIFQLAGSVQTMAELSTAEKNRISHRALAILAAKPILAQIFKY
ncbi:MAG: RdgB/HAM1 family non-canonical purine NTP pyrophosphatase [Anaerolineaceae bacterium]|nr:RdgB/HAM1 family non-canonical purine NTP pyrophosphatase [Anaerolineaceae bacterium]